MEKKDNIRNFSIIAHIDHGKSTLADRMLEKTGTIDKREMKDQVLDSMDLERERGITIKMQPVSMKYKSKDGSQFIFNLIDTPGHIDFSYEVSRALRAVEGALLLVDASQGLQAQTFSTLESARKAGITIIPVLSKVDSSLARLDDVKMEIIELLDTDPDDILETSGKTGIGVDNLLEEIVKRVPSAETNLYAKGEGEIKALIFDFEYSEHRGVIVYVRVFDGQISAKSNLKFAISGNSFVAQEVGIFSPSPFATGTLSAGQIGYIVTGLKQSGLASVGDTVVSGSSGAEALPGYEIPAPVIWASLYPPSQDIFFQLSQALSRLKLSDASLQYEEEASGILGRGFRMGFLGMLHLEIIIERLKREFGLDLIVTSPSVEFLVTAKNNEKPFWVYTPAQFPSHGDILSVQEPWAEIEIIIPSEYYQMLMPLFSDFEVVLTDSVSFGDKRSRIYAQLPLRELMRNFFDQLKSITSGYASFSYKQIGLRSADVVKLEVLVADEVVPALTRIIPRYRIDQESQALVEKLEKLLPKQQFVYKVQGQALGRIWASRSIKAYRKDVTAKLYGGDITRKMKLREKQKEGKKKMAEGAKVSIPHNVFVKMLKSD